jgi:nucleoside-diphosphate-sugar epimerase
MKKKAILITGSNGFVAQNLCEKLQRDHHYKLIGLSRSSNKNQLLDHFIQYDLSSGTDTISDECSFEVDTIIHCAAQTGLSPYKKKFIESNLVGTQKAVEWAKKQGIKNFVFLSTPSIYLAAKNQYGISEDEIPEKFLTSYAETKYLAEEYLRSQQDHFKKIIILRPATVYGKGNQNVKNIIHNLLEKRKVPLFRKTAACMSMTSINNLIYSIALSLDSKLEGVYTFNIADQEPVYLANEFVKILVRKNYPYKLVKIPFKMVYILSLINYKIHQWCKIDREIMFNPYLACNFGVDRTLSIESAEKLLGFRPKYKFRNEFDDFVNWVLSENGRANEL